VCGGRKKYTATNNTQLDFREFVNFKLKSIFVT
jgi:hypothetical protein